MVHMFLDVFSNFVGGSPRGSPSRKFSHPHVTGIVFANALVRNHIWYGSSQGIIQSDGVNNKTCYDVRHDRATFRICARQSSPHSLLLKQVANLWAAYNSNALEPNFTKRGCEGSLDIVVIPIGSLFPEFLLVFAQRPSEDCGVWIFSQKGRFGAQIFGGRFSWEYHH